MKPNFSVYQGYSAADFATDSYFQQWVWQDNEAVDRFWRSYLETHPEQADQILEARELVQYGKALPVPALTEEEKAALKQDILATLEAPRGGRIRAGWFRWTIGIAAAAAGIYFSLPFFQPAKKIMVPETLVAQTGTGETRSIVLPDSSVVTLNANSRISYPEDLNTRSTRAVSLTGNAFFKVMKKTSHASFEVHTASLTVAVLGTQFNVNARSRQTEVALTEGKVKLTGNTASRQEMLLAPGEKANFDTASGNLGKSAMDKRLYAAWTEGEWRFSSTSMADIAGLIEAYYGIPTVFRNNRTRNKKITAVIPVTNLPTLIKILSKTLDLPISQEPKQLIVQH